MTKMVIQITAVYNRRIIYLSQVKYLFRIIGARFLTDEERFFNKTNTSHAEFCRVLFRQQGQQ